MKTFRAWITERGGAVPEKRRRGDEVRLVDIETNAFRILVRFLYRRRPFYFAVIPFFNACRGTCVFRLGRKLR